VRVVVAIVTVDWVVDELRKIAGANMAQARSPIAAFGGAARFGWGEPAFGGQT
jgi:hypothetical protein